jgi:hypothetical protein
LNQQERISKLALTSSRASQRIKKLQGRRLLVGAGFVLTLVGLVVYSDLAYANTLISLLPVISIGVILGILISLLLPKALKLNLGVILLFAAALISLFFAINTNIGDGRSRNIKLQVVEKSTYSGRNASPYVSVNYHGFERRFPVCAPAYVLTSKYVLLNIKTGCFGFEVINDYKLLAK